MFRVAQGKGWDNETVQQERVSSIHFGSSSTPGQAHGRRIGVSKHSLGKRVLDMVSVDLDNSGTSSTPTAFASINSIKSASGEKQLGGSGLSTEIESSRDENTP